MNLANITRYRPNKTPILAKDMQAIVDELRRLGNISVAAPLEMYNTVSGWGIRLKSTEQEVAEAITVTYDAVAAEWTVIFELLTQFSGTKGAFANIRILREVKETLVFNNTLVGPADFNGISFIIPTISMNYRDGVIPTNLVEWKIVSSSGPALTPADATTIAQESFTTDDNLVTQLVRIDFFQNLLVIIGVSDGSNTLPMPSVINVDERKHPVAAFFYDEANKKLKYDDLLTSNNLSKIALEVDIDVSSTNEVISLKWGRNASDTFIGPVLRVGTNESTIGGGPITAITGRYEIGFISTDASGKLTRIFAETNTHIPARGLTKTFSFVDNAGDTQNFQFSDGLLVRHDVT